MLTSDLLRSDVGGGRVKPRYVDPASPELLALAGDLRSEFLAHVGRSRGELKAALEGRARSGDRVRLERGLAKLLEDRCEFERGSELDPETVRTLVFARAAEARRGGVFERTAVLEGAAAALGVATVHDVEVALDADRRTREKLLSAEDLPEAKALLERYNVALAQAVLLRAVTVRVSLEGTPRRLRHVLRAVKFRRLLFRAEKTRSGVALELDGPFAIFESSTKYGLNLAEVLPAVLLCERFTLEAELAWGARRSKKLFLLGHEDGIRSSLPDPGACAPPELEAFAARFMKLHPGWKVDDRTQVVFVGGEAVVPDLRFVHESGRTGSLELIAAARRGSLGPRLALLHEHAPRGLVVAVARSLLEEGAVLPRGVVVFRSMPSAEEVKAELDRQA